MKETIGMRLEVRRGEEELKERGRKCRDANRRSRRRKVREGESGRGE